MGVCMRTRDKQEITCRNVAQAEESYRHMRVQQPHSRCVYVCVCVCVCVAHLSWQIHNSP